MAELRVVKGTKRVGEVGRRFWQGPDRFRPGQTRIGLEFPDGKKEFFPEWALVLVAGPGHELPKREKKVAHDGRCLACAGEGHCSYTCDECPPFGIVAVASEHWDGEPGPYVHAYRAWVRGEYHGKLGPEDKYFGELWGQIDKDPFREGEAYAKNLRWVEQYEGVS